MRIAQRTQLALLFPLPLLTGDQLHLWGLRNRDDNRPSTTFGFGLGMHF